MLIVLVLIQINQRVFEDVCMSINALKIIKGNIFMTRGTKSKARSVCITVYAPGGYHFL